MDKFNIDLALLGIFYVFTYLNINKHKIKNTLSDYLIYNEYDYIKKKLDLKNNKTKTENDNIILVDNGEEIFITKYINSITKYSNLVDYFNVDIIIHNKNNNIYLYELLDNNDISNNNEILGNNDISNNNDISKSNFIKPNIISVGINIENEEFIMNIRDYNYNIDKNKLFTRNFMKWYLLNSHNFILEDKPYIVYVVDSNINIYKIENTIEKNQYLYVNNNNLIICN